MHGFQLPRFEAIQALLALLGDRDDADLAEYTQMFGDGWLRDAGEISQQPGLATHLLGRCLFECVGDGGAL